MTTEPQKTKFQEDIDGVVTTVKDITGAFKSGYTTSNPTSAAVSSTVTTIINSPASVWLCAGIALEAAGITVQMLLRIDMIPLMDAVVGTLLALGLYHYQKKRKGDDTTCLKEHE